MPNKLTKFIFHVAADNGIDVGAKICVDRVVVWNGRLKHTVPNLQTVDINTIASDDIDSAYCDIDLPTTEDKQEKHNKLITIQIWDGTVMFVSLAQSHNPSKIAVADPSDPGGKNIMLNAGGHVDLTSDYFITTQPLWNEKADLFRYNFPERVNERCPGTILINHGETCEFTVLLWGYCPNFFWL